MRPKSIGDLFDKASNNYCTDESCFLGTCPVNCLASLLDTFFKSNNEGMIYGCYKLLERLSK